MEILRQALERSGASSEFAFEGRRHGHPLSDTVFLKLLGRLGVEATGHGFRSSFRDWAAETTGFPAEVAEMALAHAIADKTEAAYRRGDLFGKRRQLMEAWAGFVCGGVGKVVSLKARA